ncbi:MULTISPECIES: hypothetical protein [unclassified Rhodosalinus]|uniref:hypothetical protein n=1 Tax=unclassified Rhodosalinus TaxID=2630183 RepID=UPI003525CCC1
MGVAEDLADALARDVIAAAEELGDDTVIDEVAKALGQSSTTTEEAFMTSVRVRIAERRARRVLEKAVARRRAEGATPAPAPKDGSAESGATPATKGSSAPGPAPAPAPKRADTRRSGPRIPRPPATPRPKTDGDR